MRKPAKKNWTKPHRAGSTTIARWKPRIKVWNKHVWLACEEHAKCAKKKTPCGGFLQQLKNENPEFKNQQSNIDRKRAGLT